MEELHKASAHIIFYFSTFLPLYNFHFRVQNDDDGYGDGDQQCLSKTRLD